jgi:Spy/CpxP family protein refolding chaperone
MPKIMRIIHRGSLGALALSAALAAPPAAQAQAGMPTSGQDEIELTRANIQTRRQEIVQSMMELTPAQSEKFWPIYREYRNEVAKLGDQKLAFMERFASQAATMSDDESRKLLDDWFKLRQKQLDLQKKYVDRFGKVLPGFKVARFYQVENALDTVVSANLQAAMPVAGDTTSQ